jgi:hypothetical protein
MSSVAGEQVHAHAAEVLPLSCGIPPMQVLLLVQMLVSSGGSVPSASGVYTQPDAALQVSVVHMLPSLQVSGVPATHEPALHVSAPLHTVLSAQEVPLASLLV